MKIRIFAIISFLFLFLSCQIEQKEDSKGIISLVPSLTDFAGLVYPEKIIGVSNQCNASFLDSSIARVGDYKGLDYEKIIELNPEKILMLKDFSSPEQVKKLKELGFEIQFFEDKTLENVLNIPLAMDSTKGKVVSDSLKNQLSHLSSHIPHLKSKISYLIFIGNDPIQVYGKGNYLSDLLESLAYSNVASEIDGAYPTLDNEFFVSHLPQIIVSGNIENTKAFLFRKFSENTFNKVLFIEINEDILSRSGPDFLKVGVTIEKKWNEYKKLNIDKI